MLWITGCGQPNPKILSSNEDIRGGVAAEIEHADKTDTEKIRALIDAVRKSEHTFVLDDIERNGAATADKLQLLLDRDVAGVRNASEFIERIAAPERDNGIIDRVILGPEESVPMRVWLQTRLAEIEGKPYAPQADPDAGAEPAADTAEGAPPPTERSLSKVKIYDALMLVERSGLMFVSPPRKHVPSPLMKSQRPRPAVSKRKPKRKEYTSREFADMLRKKWEFLGADIDDLPTFMDEIGSESFASMTPYLVIHEDGTEQEFRPWLEAELAKRAAVAQGGAP